MLSKELLDDHFFFFCFNHACSYQSHSCLPWHRAALPWCINTCLQLSVTRPLKHLLGGGAPADQLFLHFEC